MTIRTKLSLILVILAAAGICLGSILAASERSIANEMHRVERIVLVSTRVGNLVHELQKERGLTAGFLGSGGAKFSSELPAQRKETDKRVQEFAKTLASSSEGLPVAVVEAMSKAATRLDNLDALRSSITSLKADPKKAIGEYTTNTSALLDAIALSQTSIDDGASVNALAAYCALMKGKERSGIERAVLSGVFSSGKMSGEVREKLIRLNESQSAYFCEFLLLAGEKGRSAFEEMMRSPDSNEVRKLRTEAVAAAADVTHSTDAAHWFAKSTTVINQLKGIEDGLATDLEHRAGEMAAGEEAAFTLMVIVLGVLVALSVFTVVYVSRAITAPLGQIASTIHHAESSNDLSARVNSNRRDEIGKLGRAFDNLLGKLQDIVSSVKQGAASIAGSSSQLRATSDQLDDGAVTMNDRSTSAAAAVEQLSVTMSNLAGQVSTIRDNMGQASQSVESLTDRIEAVAAHTSEAASAADAACQSARASNEKITVLGAAAKEIDHVIEVIQEIAEQINLLALNATIEAARAGAAGSGFAVVAHEVKGLAKQTSEATDDIRQRIESMQARTADTVSAIGKIVGAVEGVGKLSGEIADATQDQRSTARALRDQMGGTNTATMEASNAIGEAAEASQEISEQIAHVATGSDGTARAAAETKESSSELSRLSTTLSERLSQFRS